MGLSRLPSLDPFADMDPLNVPLDIPRIDFENLTVCDMFDTKDSHDKEYENDEEVVEFKGNDQMFKMWDDKVDMEEVVID